MSSRREECLLILDEIREMVEVIIDSGVVDDMEPVEIVEETLNAFKVLSSNGDVQALVFGKPTVKKKKEMLH